LLKLPAPLPSVNAHIKCNSPLLSGKYDFGLFSEPPYFHAQMAAMKSRIRSKISLVLFDMVAIPIISITKCL
jgi:hypothetical protein